MSQRQNLSHKQPQRQSQKRPQKDLQRKSRKQLNPKQAEFLRYFQDPKSETFGNAYRSALKAGYSEAHAKQITTPSRGPEITRTAMQQALEDIGITDEFLAGRHKALLSKRDKDGQPETRAVHAGLDMAYKVKKHYPAQGLSLEDPNGKPVEMLFLRADEAKKLTETEKQALKDEDV